MVVGDRRREARLRDSSSFDDDDDTGRRWGRMSSARRPIRYPRKVTRAFKGLLKYALLAVLVAFLSRRFQPPWDDLRQDPAAPVDFAWGSVLHRFQNHPASPTPRAAFPWTTLPAPPTRAVPRVALVTFELAGLHRNGGIGTAYLELATALARSETVNVTIIVAHLASTFSSYEREAVETRSVHPFKRLFALLLTDLSSPVSNVTISDWNSSRRK
jgi:hypothetical protein